MVIQLGGTAEDSRDIFQEGLMIMLEKIDDRQFTLTCKFRTLLYCICENLWKAVLAKRYSAANYFRRRNDAEQEADFTEKPNVQQQEEIFRAAYDSLNDVQKTILKLYWDNMDPREIAKMMGYTYGYLRKKKYEAQAELIKRVKKHPQFMMLSETG
jgi:RNA polymerase sigma factor (sigma-70 family)